MGLPDYLTRDNEQTDLTSLMDHLAVCLLVAQHHPNWAFNKWIEKAFREADERLNLCSMGSDRSLGDRYGGKH